MQDYLLVVAGPDEGRTFPLADGKTLLIGRSQKSDTELKDLQVSRLHCEVRCAEGKYTVVDNESASGTFVNNARIKEQVLKQGDTIRIGETLLKLHIVGIPDAQTIAAAQKAPRNLQAESAALTGQTISHYVIGNLIAKGKTGTIYKARDERDGKDVALKVLHPNFAEDEDDVQRFVRAMKTTVSLRHPNLVAILGAGKNGPVCWVAMEYVDGESLAKVIQRIGTANMLDWHYALTVAVHIARALQAAHEQHIIHRNVMPENILIPKGTPLTAKLGDLMLAKALDGIKSKPITRPGELVGDLVYMSPERTREDAAVDTRADIYGLGATLYVLLTGRPPFEGGTLIQTLAKIRQEDPVPPKKYQLSVPDGMQDIVLKMMAKRPELRYQTPADLLKDLERLAKFQGMTV